MERRIMAGLWEQPESEGLWNGILRARQLCALRWTPIQPMASGLILTTPEGRKYIDTFFSPWTPRRGVPYSSVRIHEKYIGCNVSIETFCTALLNPESVVYTRPQHGLGRSMFNYYGTVCSVFLSYVLGFSVRSSCSLLRKDPRLTEIRDPEPGDLKLGDILLSKDHTALVTGILRNEEGVPTEILVAESKSPLAAETGFTLQEFMGAWISRGYGLYRYNGWDGVSYEPSPYVVLPGDPPMEGPRTDYSFLPDYGDKANYEMGETVEFTALRSGIQKIVVQKEDGGESIIPVISGKASFPALRSGYFRAFSSDEGPDKAVHFAVTFGGLREAETPDNGSCERTFFYSYPEGDRGEGYLINNEKLQLKGRGEFSPEEQKNNCFKAVFPGPGTYTVAAVIRNRYGCYRSERLTVRIPETT